MNAPSALPPSAVLPAMMPVPAGTPVSAFDPDIFTRNVPPSESWNQPMLTGSTLACRPSGLHPILQLFAQGAFPQVQPAWDWTVPAMEPKPIGFSSAMILAKIRMGMTTYIHRSVERAERLKWFLAMADRTSIPPSGDFAAHNRGKLEDNIKTVFGIGSNRFEIASQFAMAAIGELCEGGNLFTQKGSIVPVKSASWLLTPEWLRPYQGDALEENVRACVMVTEAIAAFFAPYETNSKGSFSLPNMASRRDFECDALDTPAQVDTRHYDVRNRTYAQRQRTIQAFALEFCRACLGGLKWGYYTTYGKPAYELVKDSKSGGITRYKDVHDAMRRALPVCVRVLHALGRLNELTRAEYIPAQDDHQAWYDICMSLYHIVWVRHRARLGSEMFATVAQTANVLKSACAMGGLEAANVLTALLGIHAARSSTAA